MVRRALPPHIARTTAAPVRAVLRVHRDAGGAGPRPAPGRRALRGARLVLRVPELQLPTQARPAGEGAERGGVRRARLLRDPRGRLLHLRTDHPRAEGGPTSRADGGAVQQEPRGAGGHGEAGLGAVPVDGRGEGRAVHTLEPVLLGEEGEGGGERRVHSGGVLQGGRHHREGGGGVDGSEAGRAGRGGGGGRGWERRCCRRFGFAIRHDEKVV
mmetsp:Transcript_30769/g.65422  ORF Transcript_30769/g.65422 Transcript_30769/m.65422 type:complete len:214 (+) Transcript_30769:2820-3461(+)